MEGKTINKKLNHILKNEDPVDIIGGVKYYALTKEEIEQIMFVVRFIEAERDEYKEMYEEYRDMMLLDSGLFD